MSEWRPRLNHSGLHVVHRCIWFGMVAVLAALPATATGQDGPLSITLDEAVARAVANSQRLAELQARREAAEAIEHGRGAARQPSIALMGGYTRTNHVEAFGVALPGGPVQVIYPDVPDNYRTRLDLQWPIFTSGRLEALQRAAAAERHASGEDLVAALSDLRLETTRAFWALVTAREAEQVLTRSIASIEAHVRDLRTRFEQGLIPPSDVLSAEAQQSRERVAAIEAANSRAIAEADIGRLMGMERAVSIQPRAALEGPSAAPSHDEVLIAEARTQRAERRALQDRVASARARAQSVAAARRPQVTMDGGYDYARPNPRIFPRAPDWKTSWDVSVNASWSLWDGGRNRADRAEALARIHGVEADAAEFDRQLTFEVRQQRIELESGRAAVMAAEDGVRAASEARRVVGERFSAGVSTNTDVLDAETDLLQAELDRTRALARVRLAEARLARAVGR